MMYLINLVAIRAKFNEQPLVNFPFTSLYPLDPYYNYSVPLCSKTLERALMVHLAKKILNVLNPIYKECVLYGTYEFISNTSSVRKLVIKILYSS